MMTEFLTRLRFMIFRKEHSELDDELRFHLEQSIAVKVAAGLTASEARRQALIEFGGVERARESNAITNVLAGGSDLSRKMCATPFAACSRIPASR